MSSALTAVRACAAPQSMMAYLPSPNSGARMHWFAGNEAEMFRTPQQMKLVKVSRVITSV
jgi:hypothetical protein